MLICPSFFDGRMDGIGRVSGAFYSAMNRMGGRAPFVLSANDRVGAASADAGRCFAGNYYRMLLKMLVSPVLAERSRGIASVGSRKTKTEPRPGYPIVCTHLGLSPVARLAAARAKRPYVVFIHGVEAWLPLPGRSRCGLARAECLLFNSEFTRRGFFRYNPWAVSARTLVVPLGLTLKAGGKTIGDECRHHASFPGERNGSAAAGQKPFRILMVGRMSKAETYSRYRDATDLYKGFKQLILAVGQLTRHVPGVRLWIVGDGDARPDLEQWIAGRMEREFVDFLGRTSDDRLEQLYQAADVFALPSEGEGFGLVFVEAMAHGLPCVCVNAGAAPEVVHDGETGLVARPRDIADLADKLYVLAKNPVLRTRLSTEARRTYAERFTAQAFDERIIAALNRGSS